MGATCGATVKNTKELGSTIKCKAMELCNGQMVKPILVTLWRIKDMETEDLNGKMEENMMEDGLKVNNTASVFIEMRKGLKNKAPG